MWLEIVSLMTILQVCANEIIRLVNNIFKILRKLTLPNKSDRFLVDTPESMQRYTVTLQQDSL